VTRGKDNRNKGVQKDFLAAKEKGNSQGYQEWRESACLGPIRQVGRTRGGTNQDIWSGCLGQGEKIGTIKIQKIKWRAGAVPCKRKKMGDTTEEKEPA